MTQPFPRDLAVEQKRGDTGGTRQEENRATDQKCLEFPIPKSGVLVIKQS